MQFVYLRTADRIKSLIEWHNANSAFVTIDTETTSVNPREAKLIDIQIAGYTSREAVLFDAEFLPLLAALKVPQLYWNFKYDWHVMYRHGLDMRGKPVIDAMLLDHLADENRSHALSDRVKTLYNDTYKDDFWAKHDSYEQASLEDRIQYACKDIVYTGHVYTKILHELRQDNVPDSLIEHVHSLALSLYDTELAGISVDRPHLIRTGVKLNKRIEELRKEMREAALVECVIVETEAWEAEKAKRKTEKGKANVELEEFSFDSPKQVAELLYKWLELPPQKDEKTKKITVNSAALSKLEGTHKVVSLLQEYRDHTKVEGTYISGTLERMDNGRIYPGFNVNGTVTGRLSSSNPNMQQLPREGGIRGIYIPDDGHKLISADYSSLEVCVEAHYTQDRNLLRVVNEGISKHDITAQNLGVDRNTAKTLNFALQYHCSAWKVAKLLGVNEKEGKEVYDRYWEIYAGCKKLKDWCDRQVDAGIPLVNLMGRKRRFPAMRRQPWDGAYRQAYNFLIQSTGADITNRAFYMAEEYLAHMKLGKALFVVHDEIVASAPAEKAVECEVAIVNAMNGVPKQLGLSVALKAVGSGPMDRWED